MVPLRLAEIARRTSAAKEIAYTALSNAAVFSEEVSGTPLTEEQVLHRETELTKLEAQVARLRAGSAMRRDLSPLVADLNARQLQELLVIGDIDRAIRRAFSVIPGATNDLSDERHGPRCDTVLDAHSIAI